MCIIRGGKMTKKFTYQELENENCYLRQEIRGLKKENAKLKAACFFDMDFIRVNFEGDNIIISTYNENTRAYSPIVKIFDNDCFSSEFINSKIYDGIMNMLTEYQTLK